MVHPAMLDHQDQLELEDQLDSKDLQVHQDHLVPRAQQDSLVDWGLQDHRDLEDREVLPDLQVHLVGLVLQVELDHLGHQDNQDQMDSLVLKELRVTIFDSNIRSICNHVDFVCVVYHIFMCDITHTR